MNPFLMLRHTLNRFMLFQVKDDVQLDDHGGQYQQSNRCKGDEETWTAKTCSYLMLILGGLWVCGRGRQGFTKGVGRPCRGGSVGVWDSPGGRGGGGGGG